MQTRRRVISLATDVSASALKPSLTSVFKHSKARSSERTLVTKSSSKNVTTNIVKVKTISSTVTKDVKPKEVKPKAPEDNPRKKMPLCVPSYAQKALEHLCAVDQALAPIISRHPYMIHADHDTNYFRVLSRTILGQQIHWKAARSIIFKFVSNYFPAVTLELLDSGDKTFPTPEQVLATSMGELRLCGLSERKASYLQDLARHFVEGKITFTDQAMLQAMTDEEIASQLLCVRGIGQWTVDMFMMTSLERLDVLPTLDLGVRRGMERHFASHYKKGVWVAVKEKEVSEFILEEKVENDNGVATTIKKVVVKKKSAAKGKGKAKSGEMSCDDMERMAEHWRPYRSIASWYMWRTADAVDVITAPI
ncbi:hypothetical protein BGZ99_008873 [Dissophora globulifera]|uniref:HhH-GPD domain-containing protein n=1 Tax=Dissophora globulifera TaxID=979702 RepID=A0A9P6RRU9_9FUNG|nr:hypothetical protein BGZ99_008873 [Dissophora globulifera]